MVLVVLVLFCFVCMDAFPKEGSGYPIRDFASRPGTEQTLLLPWAGSILTPQLPGIEPGAWHNTKQSGMHLWSWKLESDARAKDALKSESLDQPCLSSFNNFSDVCRWHCFSYEKQRHLVIISKLPSLSLQAFVNSHLKISILALSRLKVLL